MVNIQQKIQIAISRDAPDNLFFPELDSYGDVPRLRRFLNNDIERMQDIRFKILCDYGIDEYELGVTPYRVLLTDGLDRIGERGESEGIDYDMARLVTNILWVINAEFWVNGMAANTATTFCEYLQCAAVDIMHGPPVRGVPNDLD